MQGALSRRLTGCSALLFLGVPAALRAQERPFELEGLVVTATPTPRPVESISSSVTVLEGAELRARGLTRVLDALREVPGVDVVQGGSYGSVTSLFVRGAESDHVLVLIDGVQVNQPGGAFDFAGLTLDNVERVEVVRGPASALYGSDAVAGVVQVVTRSGHGAWRGTVSSRFGTYGRREWSAEAAAGGDRAGYALSLSGMRTDGILAFNNASDNRVFSGSVRFAPDERSWSRITVSLGNRAYHFPTDGGGVPIDRNAFTFGDETVVGAAVGRRLADRVTLGAHLSLNEVDAGTDDAADGPADTLGYFGLSSLDHVRRAGADVRAVVQLGTDVVTTGVEIEAERQRSFTESQSEYGATSDRSAFSRRNRALYGHLSGDHGPVALDVGVRLEANERFGRLATWQVGGVLRLDGEGATRLRASAGTAVKEPTFFENYATGFARGNPDLDPERSTSWEVGLDHTAAAGRLGVSASFFHQALRDLIQYTFVTPSPADPNFFNVAAADARGVEVEARLRSGPVTGTLSWTWLHTEVIDAGYDEGPGATFVEGAPLIRRPAQTLAARAAYAAGTRARFAAGATLVGARADRDFSTYPSRAVTLPAWLDLSAGAELRVLEGGAGRPSVSLTLRGENLLDRQHQEVFGFPAPGRVLLVGARAGFGGS